MGTFEKLGILVIVVIIVMILAVAISQWGGMTAEGADGAMGSAVPEIVEPPLTIRHVPEMGRPPAAEAEAEGTETTWPGGIPKVHTIQRGDLVWNLVVKEWGLKETFIAAIAAANPRADMRRLQTGDTLVIPDPRPYFRTPVEKSRKPVEGAVSYEVQSGDTLELIAQKHLGHKKFWPRILAKNPGLKPHRMTPGQVIYLPVN